MKNFVLFYSILQIESRKFHLFSSRFSSCLVSNKLFYLRFQHIFTPLILNYQCLMKILRFDAK